MIINASGKSVLIISDTHFPYQHPDTFPFLEAVKKKYLNDKSIITHVGDEVDFHSVSFHNSDQELLSAGDELKIAIENIGHLRDIFPKMHLCESNHGSLLFRRMKADGIPIAVLRPLAELYETPKWSWHHELIIKTKNDNDTYICHGKKSTYNGLAKEIGMNAVQGHFHGKFEITYSRTPMTERFNMFVGCLIDWQSLAFAYGKNNIPKPITGLGYIDKHGDPHLIKMGLDKTGRWDRKIRMI